jgi:hypothetical protein
MKRHKAKNQGIWKWGKMPNSKVSYGKTNDYKEVPEESTSWTVSIACDEIKEP